MKSNIESALELLPSYIAKAILNFKEIESIDEIRLRKNKEIYLTVDGENIPLMDKDKFLISNQEDIEQVFKNAFSYSLHCYSKELASGYITTKHGNRVGICGTAVITQDDISSIESVKYISSINIRISREVVNCAQALYPYCNLGKGILLIGPPASGKTTFLRDISRYIGTNHRVSLIDELNEISATNAGVAYCDIGSNTDVFVEYPKGIGIITAIKVMSPEYIIVDEIGSESDFKALDYALHSGVSIITAVHSDSFENAIKNLEIKNLIDSGAFGICAVLSNDAIHKRQLKVINLV